ncbi:enoyl-CoA hydratase/isomerase family protein [Nocardioides humi]|uniref:Crotonase/enoyl-CoA hydratase family protein n=1 Tax=Nocardioides humi TaxID=449461 RepID=A0ABN2BSW0_9ACTN|nr:enoyl-CoA hydratase-related protein [Nocardioides humi]
MENVTYEQLGQVAVITLNRPEKRNAIDARMAHAIASALDRVETDPTIRAAVLAATVTEPRPVFCSGHDLTAIPGELEGGELAATSKGGFAGMTRYERTKPLVAAVDGLATSGGLEMVLACDLVVATTRSSFALAEVRWGLVAGAGGLFRLPWAIGPAAAMDMILTGEAIDAQRAYTLGLVGTLVEDDVVAAAVHRAELVCAHSPAAVTVSRRVADCAFALPETELWALNDRLEHDLLATDEGVGQGLQAFAQRGSATS